MGSLIEILEGLRSVLHRPLSLTSVPAMEAPGQDLLLFTNICLICFLFMQLNSAIQLHAKVKLDPSLHYYTNVILHL